MKKLVITAALLVAAASSYAIPEEFTISEDVYSVSISMKTTKGNVGPIEALHYRTVASKTYNGFYIVDNDDQFDGRNYGNEILLGYEGRVLDDEVSWNDVVRIGKNNNEIEASGMIFGGNMIVFLRGFGTYDVKNYRVSSLNGSINAFLPPPVLFGLESEPVFGRDLSDPVDIDEGGTIGFGTFSVKYSLEASKKLGLKSYATLEYFARKLGCDINDLPFGG